MTDFRPKGRDRPDRATPDDQERTRLGMVVSGSLTDGVQVRLDPATSVEEIRVGRYVTIQGERMRFFGVVTDVSLGATDPSLKFNPPDVSNPFIAQVVSGTAAYGVMEVEPMLALSEDPMSVLEGPQRAKTVPPHFSQVSLASDQDIQLVFGSEDERRFWIGNPMDMETRLCLDVEEFVKRQQRRLWQDRYRQDLFDPSASHRYSPERQGQQLGLRHAQRVRMGGLQ